MKTMYLLFALVLVLGLTSCSLNDDELLDVEQTNLMATDPPSEEAGEEEEIEPNN